MIFPDDDDMVVFLREALKSPEASQRVIARQGLELVYMLLKKNQSYGNSAFEPISMFAKNIDPMQRMMVRLDDKMSRFLHGDQSVFSENDHLDAAGYHLLFLSYPRYLYELEDDDA